MIDKIENLKKELLYKSTHRGCKEMDILLGKYAEATLNTMQTNQLLDYKQITEASDNDIYDWLTDKAITPPHFHNTINNIKQFHAKSFI